MLFRKNPRQQNSIAVPAEENFIFSRIETGIFIAAIASTATAWHFPSMPLPVTPADPLMGIAFLIVLFRLFRHSSRVTLFISALLFLAVHFLTDALNTSGFEGTIEAIQKVEYLFFGFTTFAFLVKKNKFRTLIAGVCLGLGANVAVAYMQIITQGYGNHVSGLFNSSMTLSFYLAVVLCLMLPVLLYTAQRSLWDSPLPIMTILIVLGAIPHGTIFVLALGAVLFTGFLISLRDGLITTATTILLVLAVSTGGSQNPWYTNLSETLNPSEDGRIKESHAEKVAAIRMAFDNPLTGVGSGRYQKRINTYFGKLPNPPTPAQTPRYKAEQSGWGILFATTGIPCGALFLLTLVMGASLALRAFLTSAKSNPLTLGSAMALLVVLAGMIVTDAFIRGIGWYPGLLLAFAVFSVEPNTQSGSKLTILQAGWRTVLGLTILYGVLAAAVLAAGAEKLPLLNKEQPSRDDASLKPSTTTETTEESTWKSTAGAETPATPYLEIFMPGDVKQLASPMQKTEKTQNEVPALVIPKKSLADSGEFQPELQHGGAVYELNLSDPRDCHVWVRCWWSGSCGNSISVRLNNQDPIVLGGDGTYRRWHWVEMRGKMTVPAGENKLYLLAREDGVRIHQVLLTNKENLIPQGIMQK